jgi:hypothetical protein
LPIADCLVDWFGVFVQKLDSVPEKPDEPRTIGNRQLAIGNGLLAIGNGTNYNPSALIKIDQALKK